MAAMAHTLAALANGAVLLFVVTTMLAMGFGLTVAQILAPLRRVRLIMLALVANFVLFPLLAPAFTHIIPLSDPRTIGLILLGAAAGALCLFKLAQFAHGNVASRLGLLVLLMIITIVYPPMVLPLFLPGVRVAPLSIAVALLLTLLPPLGLALLVRTRYPEPAGQLQPLMGQASSAALLLVLMISLLATLQELIGVIGTGGILVALVLICGGVVFGVLLNWYGGEPGGDTRFVLGLGTGQRNSSAARRIATQSFTDPNVLAMVLVGSTLGLLVLLQLAFELGRRAARAAMTAVAVEGASTSTRATASAMADLPPPGAASEAGS
jgi:BASS family bile acid:Na+ symporter